MKGYGRFLILIFIINVVTCQEEVTCNQKSLETCNEFCTYFGGKAANCKKSTAKPRPPFIIGDGVSCASASADGVSDGQCVPNKRERNKCHEFVNNNGKDCECSEDSTPYICFDN